MARFVTSKLNLWINPIVDRATAESDFSLTDLRRIPTSIYLGVSPDELDRVAPLYNLSVTTNGPGSVTVDPPGTQFVAGSTITEIVAETLKVTVSERGATRMDDRTSDASMERRKKEGYF